VLPAYSPLQRRRSPPTSKTRKRAPLCELDPSRYDSISDDSVFVYQSPS
jgi:hypothetical protein